MNDIRDIRICGIDETRPPRIRKEPYIDLYFKLSSQAPALWCELFNDRVKLRKITAKIKPETGLVIDTWVRQIEEIEPALLALKSTVAQTTEAYLARLKADAERATGGADAVGDTGEQGRLNRVVASLDFEQ